MKIGIIKTNVGKWIASPDGKLLFDLSPAQVQALDPHVLRLQARDRIDSKPVK